MCVNKHEFEHLKKNIPARPPCDNIFEASPAADGDKPNPKTAGDGGGARVILPRIIMAAPPALVGRSCELPCASTPKAETAGKKKKRKKK